MEKSTLNNCVGIDLGTTNSVLAIITNKLNGDIVSKVLDLPRPVDRYVANGGSKITSARKPTLPSCVYYQEDNNYEPLVGDFAKSQYSLRPHLVAKSIKSQMGKPLAEGLSLDIPDKTPAQISAQILKQMLKQAEKMCRCYIDDAIITVPANFDSIMCQATREAARIAGIKVTNPDGSEKDILLSEPKAVIYDLINSIHNGDIPSNILMLDKPKMVIVFDLGGGTLDITLHEIKKNEECDEILKIREIATNRYTLLGGDDFDELIANNMFERYLKQYSKYPEIVKTLKEEKNTVLAKLRTFAEDLKIELSEKGKDNSEDDFGWEGDEEDFPVGGNMGTGYAYDDNFTKEEVEAILKPFLAENLSFYDYKNLANIKDTRNIIFPILDVLQKASEKLNISDVAIDAVIVNGGMSKFYMITDRLTKFFGFEPIVALDPDQSVARGAAVYHHYLHKYENMMAKEAKKFETTTLQKVGNNDNIANSNTDTDKIIKPSTKDLQNNGIDIDFGSNILNDSLYLGAKNGATSMIIPTGVELPYTSEIMTGYKVSANQNIISIPIKSKNIDGTFRTIARGKISLERKYTNGAFIAFTIFMSKNKVITMNAWTSSDEAGKQKLELCSTDIDIGNNEDKGGCRTKVVLPSGSELNAQEEINTLIQLCNRHNNSKKPNEKKNINKKISEAVSNICNAKNKSDFGPIILGFLEKIENDYITQRLFKIARKHCEYWSDSEKKHLAEICLDNLRPALKGWGSQGLKVSSNIEAIYTLAVCANTEQLNVLEKLHDNSKYKMSCLYTHGKTKTNVKWIASLFEEDCDITLRLKGIHSGLQQTAYALGIALRRNNNPSGLSKKEEERLIKKLIATIDSGSVNEDEISVCVLALGWSCDRRLSQDVISNEVKVSALKVLNDIEYKYQQSAIEKSAKPRILAQKMICGEALTQDEEEYLLTKLEK